MSCNDLLYSSTPVPGTKYVLNSLPLPQKYISIYQWKLNVSRSRAKYPKTPLWAARRAYLLSMGNRLYLYRGLDLSTLFPPSLAKSHFSSFIFKSRASSYLVDSPVSSQTLNDTPNHIPSPVTCAQGVKASSHGDRSSQRKGFEHSAPRAPQPTLFVPLQSV